MKKTLMTEFRGAVLFEQNTPLRIVAMEKQDPSEGQVAIRMISAALCGAQWNEITGVKGPDTHLPHLIGHEGLGEVVATGKDVTKVRAGDVVILHWRKGGGCDCVGASFVSRVGRIGSGPVTTFSDYTLVSENRVTPIHYHAHLKHVYPLVGCALSTSWGLLSKETKATAKDTLLICGAGGLGLAIAFWARIFSLKRVAVFDRSESKRPMVEALGGDFHEMQDEGCIGSLNEGFDIVVDTTGNVRNIAKCFDRVSANGKLVLVGQPQAGSILQLNNPIRIFDGISIFASAGGLFSPDEDIPRILPHLESNAKMAKNLVSHVISLDEVNEGFDLMRFGSAARVAIDLEVSL